MRPAFPPTPDDAPAGADVHALHQQLIGLRRRHPWLVDAEVQKPDALTNDVLALRLARDGQVIGVVLNVGDTPAHAVLPMRHAEVLAGDGGTEGHRDGTRTRVAAHSFVVVGTA